MSRQMRADEAHSAVHQLHANRSAALVSHHAQETRGCCGGCPSPPDPTPTHHLLHTTSQRLADKHAQKHAHQDLMLHQHVGGFLPFREICSPTSFFALRFSAFDTISSQTPARF